MSSSSDAVQDYWTALTRGDTAAGRAVADEVLASSGPGAIVGLVRNAQARVGEEWLTGAWTVADEHRATAVAEQVLSHAIEQAQVAGSGVVLVASAEREYHSVPGQLVTLSLLAQGHRAIFLGPSTLREGLMSRVIDTGPRAVLISATLASSLHRVRRQIEAVRGTGTPVLVGGSAFDAAGTRASRLGANGWAADPAEVPRLLDALPRHVEPATPLRSASALEAHALIADSATTVRAVLDDLVEPGGVLLSALPDDWQAVRASSVPHLVDCLASGLLIDDRSIVDEMWAWLEAALAHRDAPAAAVVQVRSALSGKLRDYPLALRMAQAS